MTLDFLRTIMDVSDELCVLYGEYEKGKIGDAALVSVIGVLVKKIKATREASI